jgi:hypothetical protein
MALSITTNGVHGPTGQQADSDVDLLYSFWPGTTPAPQPCPEALFSCTLRGHIDKVETLLTIRGMTATEFKANLEQVRGLLDPVPTPPAQGPTQGQDKSWCAVHDVSMTLNQKEGRSWWSHKTADGWCKGK